MARQIQNSNDLLEWELTDEEKFSALNVPPEFVMMLINMRSEMMRAFIYVDLSKPPEEVVRVQQYNRARLDVLNELISSLPPV